MKKILTIIVTYNGMKWLDQCLSSVNESTLPSDIFIVDNGSTDGSIEFIRKIVPEAIFIESKENLGFGKANNLGLKYAVENGYDYVYLLNQDAWIEPKLLEKMVEVSETHPEYGILSPLQVNKEKTRLDKNFSHNISPQLSSDLLCSQPLQEVYDTKFIMAAHWLIPVKKLEEIGGFSPAFKHYGEDNNLIHRTWMRGYKLGIVPSVKGVHDRENRPLPLEKAKYLDYVLTVAMLNNPNIKRKFISMVKKNIRLMMGSPLFSIKYTVKSFGDYFKSIKYRKMYKKEGVFLK